MDGLSYRSNRTICSILGGADNVEHGCGQSAVLTDNLFNLSNRDTGGVCLYEGNEPGIHFGKRGELSDLGDRKGVMDRRSRVHI